MSRQHKRQKHSESASKLSETGTGQEKLIPLELPQDSDGTTSPVSWEQWKELPLFMHGYLLTNKEKTSTDKRTTSSRSTRKRKSSRKSVVDSTTEDKNLKLFWNELCQEMSNALWLPTETDWLALVSTYSDSFVNQTIANSWFATTQVCLQKGKWWKTFWQSFTSSLADSTVCGNTKSRSRKIRVYPQTELRLVWRQWLSASRYCYNKAMAILRDTYVAKEKLPSAYDLRKIVMKDLPDWVENSPYNLRGASVIDAHRAFKTTDKDNKKNPKFRSCRNPVKSFKLQKPNWKQNVTYPTHRTPDGVKLSELKVNSAEELPSEMPSDFSVVLDRGRWYITYTIEEKINDSRPLEKPIFSDSGVRCFQTLFDGNNIIEIGKDSISRVIVLCKRLDDILSETAKAVGRKEKRKRFNLRKKAERIRIKIRNLIDECHKKTACWLTENYTDIFLPTFESSQMVRKTKRKLNSKTARNMMTWSHYRFEQTLKFQCEKRGVRLHIITEEYTSKTCSKCGKIHPKLGGKKIFKCPHCDHVIPRDFNGAINIAFKTLSSWKGRLDSAEAHGIC